MMEWKLMGNYFGKPIRVAEISAPDKYSINNLQDSVLLVLFENEYISDDKNHKFLSSLIWQQPMAIMVCGVGAREAFDFLVIHLGDGTQRKQIMTKLFEEDSVEAAMEDFFLATWPSDDRFDAWRSYAILIVGNGISDAEQIIRKFCD